jgi:hypothetical protein
MDKGDGNVKMEGLRPLTWMLAFSEKEAGCRDMDEREIWRIKDQNEGCRERTGILGRGAAEKD